MAECLWWNILLESTYFRNSQHPVFVWLRVYPFDHVAHQYVTSSLYGWFSIIGNDIGYCRIISSRLLWATPEYRWVNMVVVLPLVGLIRPKIHSQCVLTSLLINWKNVRNCYCLFSLMIITIENLCYHELLWQNWNIICNCVHIK